MEGPDEMDDYCPKDFHEMELDDRILKAVAKLGWVHPTLIQERAIPLLLEGKDVLVRARTGSGKTGAFGIPAIQKVLSIKQMRPDETGIKVLVLAPSRELCRQLQNHLNQLSTKCGAQCVVVDISAPTTIAAQRPLINTADILVSTPARILAHLRHGCTLDSLKLLIIDEADLIFSFGHEDDVKHILKYLPRVVQASLASATLSEDVLQLKKLVLRQAVTLKLEEPALAPAAQLAHYYLFAEEEDKATILYTLLKLTLLRGKTIVFTNTVDKCYKLKLYLEQFSIPCCVLNSELPAAVRCHTVAQFNDGLYDIIVASDEASLETPAPGNQQPGKKGRKKDKQSGVARGIDFQFVSNVINFDFPLDITSYVHRAGRTARGVNKGSVLSLISFREKELMDKVDQYLKEGLNLTDSIFRLYEMRMEDIEGFRYRSRDAWRATTRIAVREARLKEIKQEILNSAQLKGYFEENPRELKTLRHDRAARTVKVGQHLSNVPDYLVPDAVKRALGSEGVLQISKPTTRIPDTDDVLTSVKRRKRQRKAPTNKHRARKGNPLINFDVRKKRRKMC